MRQIRLRRLPRATLERFERLRKRLDRRERFEAEFNHALKERAALTIRRVQ